ncbi:MAG: adenylate/guanylate cyclase domain-containing protein [Ignavibacteria bacterium]|jgi:adenylate cyclase
MRKTQLNKILFLVGYWTLGGVFYVSFEATVLHTYGPIIRPYDFSISIAVAVLGTIVPSTLIGSFEILYFSKLLRRKPFGISLLIKTSFYLFSIFVFSSIAVLATDSLNLDKSVLHPEVIDLYVKYLSSPGVIMMMVYWGLFVMSGIFIIHINDYFGHGVLLNFLFGRYHTPKEEVRIFMFMDLKSSTSYAEEHGHIKYSHLIQDCFYDLTDIVYERCAEVYQYVGDEVILTWKLDIGVDNNNCLRTFFDFDRTINTKKEYYLSRYGIVPEFKAGLHYGDVIVTEIGGAKEEIAYHGDTVNTTARLQEVCKEYEKKLILSAEVLSILHDKELDKKYHIESEGITQLKGKKHAIGIFSVEEKV